MTLLRRLAPAIAALVGLVVVWVVRPGVVENAVRSPVAGAVILGTLLAGVGLRVVARRLGASPGMSQILGTGLVVVLVAVVLAPSFRQRTLVEELPDALAAAPVAPAAAEPDTSSPRPAVGTVAPAPTGPSTAATAGAVAASAKPSQPRSAQQPATQTGQQPSTQAAQQPAAQPSPQPASQRPVPQSPAAQPTQQPASTAEVDRSGPLKGIGHSASGTILLRTASGRAYVVFSDVNIEGTVDPSVHLVPDGNRTPAGGVRLGKLKAEKGTFSYELPASVDPTQRWSVLVWCDPYDTPIAAADPR